MQVQQYKRLFLTEARDKLAEIEDLVITLEKKRNDTKVVENLLLHLHALKGDAATMDYQGFANAVHQIEEFFIQVRKGERELTLDQIDACFVAIDAFRRDLDHIQAEDTETDLGPALAFTFRMVPKTPKTKRGSASASLSRDRSVVQYAPLASYVEVGAESLEKALSLANDIVSVEQQLQRMLQTNNIGALKIGLYNLSTQASDLRKQIVDMKLIPVRQYFAFLARLVRDLARQQKKFIAFRFKDNDMRFEARILESLREVCVQLVKNAVDHGFREGERGVIQLSFHFRSDQMQMIVQDTGHGFDWEALARVAIKKGMITKVRLARLKPDERKRYLSSAGVSSRETATLVSGRALGLPFVRSTVEQLGGALMLTSGAGRGTAGTLCEVTVPLKPTLFRAVTWQWGNYYLALPLFVTEKILQLPVLAGAPKTYEYKGSRIPVVTTAAFIEASGIDVSQSVAVAIVRHGDARRALLLPSGVREQELIAHSMPAMKRFERIESVAVSEDALPVTILDHRRLFNTDHD